MNGFQYILAIFAAALCLLTAGSNPARSATPLELSQQGDEAPMVIKSNTLEADDKRGVVTFTGEVEAKRSDFTVYCGKMVIYYKKSPQESQSEAPSTRIEKIVATGNVKIIRTQGGVATGEQAVYYQKDEKLVLTGSPRVKQNDNSVEGDRITLFLKEDRSVVESSPDTKVKAVIFPSEDKGKAQTHGR